MRCEVCDLGVYVSNWPRKRRGGNKPLDARFRMKGIDASGEAMAAVVLNEGDGGGYGGRKRRGEIQLFGGGGFCPAGSVSVSGECPTRPPAWAYRRVPPTVSSY